MKPVTLTIDLLKSKGACQIALTDLETTHGRTVTFRDPPTLARALQASGELTWFAANMLTNTIRAEYMRQRAPIWAECDRQRAPIRAEYSRQHAPIRAEYERQRAPIRAEYDRQCVPIWAEYGRQHAPIRAEYERQRAPILAEYARQDTPIRAEYERQRATIVATLYFEQVSGRTSTTKRGPS